MPAPTSHQPDLFKRGFTWGEVGGAAESWTSQWHRTEVAGATLRHHPLAAFRSKVAPGVRLHCLGLICDVFDLGLDDDAVAQGLADALARSWTDFYRALKTTGGTYALFLESDRFYVVLDACGTVPVVHGHGALASHPRLIAEGNGLGKSELATAWTADPALQAGGHYLPGLLTPYDGVEVVMPNHRLDVRSGEMERFYPDTDFVVRDPDEIVARVAPALSGQLERLDRPLAIGLSGGMDSRLTLAASRPVQSRARYFTYYKPDVEILLRDVEVAGQLAADLGLNHETLAIPEQGPPEMERDFALVTDGLRGPANLLSRFVESFPEPSVHVRSNILETIRGFWLKNPANRKDAFDAATLHRLFRRSSPTEFIPVFADYMERTQFESAAFRGFHWADIFYWEHRMGAWLGPAIRGDREALDTYIIYNSRALLELMMSRPLEDRVSAQLVSLLMEELWPEVLDAPFFSGSKFVHLPHPTRALVPEPDAAPGSNSSRWWARRGRRRGATP